MVSSITESVFSMKILYLNYEYPPIGGGASTATEAILKQWAKTPAMEVHLVTSALGAQEEHIHVGENVYVHRVPIGKDKEKLHSQSMRNILVYSYQAWRFSVNFIKEENKKQHFDATLAFFTVPCGFIGYLLKLQFRIPYAVSLRGADVPGFSEKYKTFYLFAKPLVRFLWRQAAAVIPNSAGICELAHKTSPQQAMQIIENGVDTEIFKPAAVAFPLSSIIFLSTSRLTPRKGIDKLIEAFALAVKKSSTPLELHLIGEGEQRNYLEERVRTLGIVDSVKFFGRIEHDYVGACYSQTHVFVMPSKNEGMSNSALEAMASGLALVVSNTGGMQELVTDGGNGFIIDPNDPESFAEILLRFVNNTSLIATFGMASRRRAEARGWGNVAQQFRTILEKGINN